MSLTTSTSIPQPSAGSHTMIPAPSTAGVGTYAWTNPQTGTQELTGYPPPAGVPFTQGAGAVAAWRQVQGTNTPIAGSTSGDSSSSSAIGQGTGAQNDAIAIIRQELDNYGLGSLADWAWGLITQGASAAQVDLQLRQRPEFAQRFPGIAERQKAGLPPISPGDYVSYENQADSLAKQYGLPSGFLDHTMMGKLIGGDTSVNELSTRLQDYQQAAFNSPPELQQEFQTLYGRSPGELTAFFIDPDRALPLIQKQFAAAQIAAQSQISHFGQLTQTQAEMLANQGVSLSQATSGFGQLGLESQLFNPLPGQEGQHISTDQALAAQFQGDATSARLIQQAQQGRIAAFAGGGSYAGSSGGGLTGLGTESQAQART